MAMMVKGEYWQTASSVLARAHARFLAGEV